MRNAVTYLNSTRQEMAMRLLASWWDRVPVQMRHSAPLVVIAAWSFFGLFQDISHFISQNSPVGFLWS